MKTYLFNTAATMKEHDRKNWWIDRDIIPEHYINAESVKDALTEYVKIAAVKHYVFISENALKTKSAMYIDLKDGGCKQTGYVITGKTSIEGDNYHYVDKYIDLWIDISIVETPNFDEE